MCSRPSFFGIWLNRDVISTGERLVEIVHVSRVGEEVLIRTIKLGER